MDTGNGNRISDQDFTPDSLASETSPGEAVDDVDSSSPDASLSNSSPSNASPSAASLPEVEPGLVAASQPFIGRWNELVSTTNWEKGRIIHEWREALVAADAPVTQYSDEAWTRLVQGVTPQHVGRLRRVYSRFAALRDQFPRLYWSHFHAAIDWDDAEMWLEGAVQSQWSVSQMRRQRWETLGALESQRPEDASVVTSDLDEDVVAEDTEVPDRVRERLSDLPAGPLPEGPDFGDEPEMDGASSALMPPVDGEGEQSLEGPQAVPAEAVRPFENLPALPDDLADAFERLKLAILHHKTDGWRDIACADLCAALEALKILAIAP